MNAYFELLGGKLVFSSNEEINIPEGFNQIKSYGRCGKIVVEVEPTIEKALSWVANVAFARIYTESFEARLRSKRTKEDEIEFLETLKYIDYDDDYGMQELFGVVVYKDGTWHSRWEYDGSEGWQLNSLPKESEVFDDCAMFEN